MRRRGGIERLWLLCTMAGWGAACGPVTTTTAEREASFLSALELQPAAGGDPIVLFSLAQRPPMRCVDAGILAAAGRYTIKASFSHQVLEGVGPGRAPTGVKVLLAGKPLNADSGDSLVVAAGASHALALQLDGQESPIPCPIVGRAFAAALLGDPPSQRFQPGSLVREGSYTLEVGNIDSCTGRQLRFDGLQLSRASEPVRLNGESKEVTLTISCDDAAPTTFTWRVRPTAGPCADKDDGLYCGGTLTGYAGPVDTVVACEDGRPTESEACDSGVCGGEPGAAECQAGDPCTNRANGTYCVGQSQLLACRGHKKTQLRTCDQGCDVMGKTARCTFPLASSKRPALKDEKPDLRDPFRSSTPEATAPRAERPKVASVEPLPKVPAVVPSARPPATPKPATPVPPVAPSPPPAVAPPPPAPSTGSVSIFDKSALHRTFSGVELAARGVEFWLKCTGAGGANRRFQIRPQQTYRVASNERCEVTTVQ